ncbi:MAG: hypothetical protein JXR77_03740 [Lentisphaeria bacterium]|nr:hypothetical protein [Lentisphaeria bacterium]
MILGFGRDLRREWGLDSEAQLFFVLRWQELFAEDTYDSWQVRTASVRTILDEFLIGLDMAGTAPESYASLGTLLDEAAEIAGRDEVICEAFPAVRSSLTQLRSTWEQSRDTRTRDLQRVRREVLVLGGCLESYPRVLRAMVQEDLGNPPAQYKCRLYGLTMALAVELSAQGYSTPQLRESFTWLSTPGDSFTDRLKKFLTRLGGKPQHYHCFLPVRLSLTDVPQGGFPGVRFIRHTEIQAEVASVQEFSMKAGAAQLCYVELDAPDPVAARHAAQTQVEEAFAAIRLYHLQGDATLAGTHVLVMPSANGEGAVDTDEDRSRLGYMRSPKSPAKHLSRAATVMRRLTEGDRSRLNAVLQYHRLAMAAGTDGTRLANLWVAIECLVRLPGSGVIENVCQYIPASVSTHHIQGVVRNVAIDLRDAWRSSCPDAATLRKSAGERTSSRDIPLSTLLQWLVQDDSQAEIKALYNLVTANPLMVFRLDRVQKHYVRDAKKMAAMLRNHALHVDWQLRRIYRARNRIVHWGASPAQVRHLSQHLHSYLLLTLLNLVKDLSDHGTWGIAEALEFRRSAFEAITHTEDAGAAVLPGEAVLNPALLLEHRRRTTSVLWPVSDESDKQCAGPGADAGMGKA